MTPQSRPNCSDLFCSRRGPLTTDRQRPCATDRRACGLRKSGTGCCPAPCPQATAPLSRRSRAAPSPPQGRALTANPRWCSRFPGRFPPTITQRDCSEIDRFSTPGCRLDARSRLRVVTEALPSRSTACLRPDALGGHRTGRRRVPERPCRLQGKRVLCEPARTKRSSVRAALSTVDDPVGGRCGHSPQGWRCINIQNKRPSDRPYRDC
jgi:hypothetical protein